MAPSLSQFPDLGLLTIFKHVPLAEVIRNVGSTCANWNRLHREDLKNRRTLVLVQDYNQLEQHLKQENQFGSDLIRHVRRDDGSPWAQLSLQEQMQFDALQMPGVELTEDLVANVVDILPQISHLTVVRRHLFGRIISPVASLVQATRLINHYAPSLVSLKLHLQWHRTNGDDPDEIEVTVAALLDSINRLESLRHLTLNISTLPRLNLRARLTILSQLATFATHKLDIEDFLIPSLLQRTNNVVGIDCNVELSLNELLQLDPQLATKFRRIRIGVELIFGHYQNMRLFCSRFSSLTCLRLKINAMPMTMLSRCLSQLPHLISLELSFSIINREEPEPELAQVPSVRLLSLTVHTGPHHDTERLHLAEIFPNLQVLNLDHWPFLACAECDYTRAQVIQLVNGNPEVEEIRARIVHCMRLARQPFRRCARLHTVRLEGFDTSYRCICLTCFFKVDQTIRCELRL